MTSSSFDVLVDAPLLGILPQRISLDMTQVTSVAIALKLVQDALVTSDGHPVSLPSNSELYASDTNGVFSEVTSTNQIAALARLRIVVPPKSQGAPDLSAVYSMLGNESRAYDPNAPTIATLTITILGCNGLFNVSRLGISSAYVISYGQGRKEIHRTPVVSNNLDPAFPEDGSTFRFPVNDLSGHVRLRIMAQQFMDAFMGEALIEICDLVGTNGDILTLELGPRRHESDPDIAGAPSLGTITIRSTYSVADVDDNDVATVKNIEKPTKSLTLELEAATEEVTPDPALVEMGSMRRSSSSQKPVEMTTDVTTSIMLDVMKLVVADAVASIPHSDDNPYELSLRKLDVIRGGVMEDRGALGQIPNEEVSQAFFRALLEGFSIGVRNRTSQRDENKELHEQVDTLHNQVDALQARLNKTLNDLESAQEALAAQQVNVGDANLRSPTASYATHAPPCTPSVQCAPEAGLEPALLVELPVALSDSSQARDLEVTPATTAPETSAAIEIPTDEQRASLDYTMVVCFFNEFNYVSKQTQKRGRAITVFASKSSTRFDMLTSTVAATFREGLSIAYIDIDQKKHVIGSDLELSYLLLKLKASGLRPILQCFAAEEEMENAERAEVGSSPKRLFHLRGPAPAPPVATSTPRAIAPVQSPRPMSAPISRRTEPLRPISAMGAKSASTALPYDYIAGKALDDDALAREFDLIAMGASSVRRDAVLQYLDLRYESLGIADRSVGLLNRLFPRTKSHFTQNEFAIVLLRLSQI